jgi:predicted DNA-binding mobile mystery protein A
MARMRRSPEFLALKRKQLDARLNLIPKSPAPRDGWIRTIRSALGMSAAQLGRRLGLSQQGVADLERREKSGAISIATLATAAEALNCELHILLRPKSSLEEVVRAQAEATARDERDRVVHTMRLEAQDEGLDELFDERKAREAWMTERLGRLWD